MTSPNRFDRWLALAGISVAAIGTVLWISSFFWQMELGEPDLADYLTGGLWIFSLILIAPVTVRYMRVRSGTEGVGWFGTGLVLAGLFLVVFVIASWDPVSLNGITSAFNDIHGAPPFMPVGLGACSVGLLKATKQSADTSEPPRVAHIGS